jgi:hypothetical protein
MRRTFKEYGQSLFLHRELADANILVFIADCFYCTKLSQERRQLFRIETIYQAVHNYAFLSKLFFSLMT